MCRCALMSQWQRLSEMEQREVTNATLVGSMELEELMSDSSATSSDFDEAEEFVVTCAAAILYKVPETTRSDPNLRLTTMATLVRVELLRE